MSKYFLKIYAIVCSRPPHQIGVNMHDNTQTNKAVRHDGTVCALSTHHIILITDSTHSPLLCYTTCHFPHYRNFVQITSLYNTEKEYTESLV